MARVKAIHAIEYRLNGQKQRVEPGVEFDLADDRASELASRGAVQVLEAPEPELPIPAPAPKRGRKKLDAKPADSSPDTEAPEAGATDDLL